MENRESEKDMQRSAIEKPGLWQRLVRMKGEFLKMMSGLFALPDAPEPCFVSHVIDDGFNFPYNLFIPEREIAALAEKLGTSPEVIKSEINRDKNKARSLEQIEKEWKD